MQKGEINNASPIFIVGYPKSGTTLLINLLDGHDDILPISEETSFFKKIVPRLSLIQDWNKDEQIDYLMYVIIEETLLSNLGLSKLNDSITGNLDYSNFYFEKFKKSLKLQLKSYELSPQRIFFIISEAFRSSSQIYCNKEYYSYILEKTPRHYEDVASIWRYFEDAKVIQIFRDPRDNWASYKKKNSKISIKNFSYYWKQASKNISTYGNAVNFHSIRYEDLVLDTSSQMERIIEFLGLPMSSSMSKPTRHGVEWRGNSMWNERSANGSISSNSVGRYISSLEPKEIRLIESYLYSYMKELDYRFSNEPSTLDHIIFRLYSAQLDIRNFNNIKNKARIFKNFKNSLKNYNLELNKI